MKGYSNSLYARVVVLFLVLLGAAGVAIWVNAQFIVAKTAATDIDNRLRATATSLLTVSASARSMPLPGGPERPRNPPRTAQTPPVPPSESSATAPEFQLVTSDRRLLARSPAFPDQAARSAVPGFENVVAEGIAWRVLTVVDRDTGATCWVALSGFAREARGDELNREFITPFLWTLPIFGIIAVGSVWRGLAPLRQIEREIALQDPRHPRPLTPRLRKVPREVAGLVAALDGLFTRIGEMLARQRAFTAAAGHELRTPLAGFKAQVQVARRAREVAAKDRALAKMERAVGGMERLVGNLLILARLDPAAPRMQRKAFDLFTCAEAAVAARRQTARRAGVSLEISSPISEVQLWGDASLIECMLGNLLDNAIRFSPRGGEVTLALALRVNCVEVRVRDAGPGIPVEIGEQVFDSFYRDRESGGSGSGLGLAIVRAVARAHGGDAKLEMVPGKEGGVPVARIPLRSRARSAPNRLPSTGEPQRTG